MMRRRRSVGVMPPQVPGSVMVSRNGAVGSSGTVPPSSRQIVAWTGGYAPGYTGPRVAGGGFGLTGQPGIQTGTPTLQPNVGSGNGWLDWLTGVGRRWIENQLNPSGGATSGSTSGEGSGGCPQGYRWNGQTCEAVGIQGTIQRTLPGGQTGTISDRYGEAVMGAFGKPALVPAVVGQRMNKRGETNPILECPTGLVLGKDNLCYPKSSIRKADRKWAPAPRPLMTAQDRKVLRRAASLQKKVKNVAKDAGLTCRKR